MYCTATAIDVIIKSRALIMNSEYCSDVIHCVCVAMPGIKQGSSGFISLKHRSCAGVQLSGAYIPYSLHYAIFCGDLNGIVKSSDALRNASKCEVIRLRKHCILSVKFESYANPMRSLDDRSFAI